MDEMLVIPAMIADDYNKCCLRPNWVIECAECLKDAIRHLSEVIALAKEGLGCEEKGFVLGGEGGAFQQNINGITRSLKYALVDIAVFSDQFRRKGNYKNPVCWDELNCQAIDDSLTSLARYMRNYFSHVRTGKQSFKVIASMEADPDKACRGDWTPNKYYKIDIQKMLSDKDVRQLKDMKIEDFKRLYTDQKYTDLTGSETGRAYIDVNKFSNAMISSSQSVWETFVEDNISEWELLRSDLIQNLVLQSKLNELNRALDPNDLKKLGWYNINGYSPSKYEVAT